MKKFTASSKGFTETILEDGFRQQVGKLNQAKWFSYDAEIETVTGHSTIKMEGFWKNEIVQYDAEGNKLRTIKNSMRGFKIHEESGENYLLAWKGFLNARLILTDENAKEWMVFRQRFQWRRFKIFYEIELKEINEKFDPAFLLTLVYCINFQMNSSSS